MARMITQKRASLFCRLSEKPVSSLYMGLIVCLCGGIAVMANLIVQRIPLSALYAAGTEAQELMLLSVFTQVLCIAGGAVVTAAIIQKKQKRGR